MVIMEYTVFMHGSSEGQSTVIPSGSPISNICNDISDKYFKGRSLRQKRSEVKLLLFVDMYRTISGDGYCVYSFVNNECFGKDGRDGQYLAITVLCKGYYIYPEAVYKMLHSAYSQMYATGKIVHKNHEGKDQYVIAQFSEQEAYLQLLLQKIGEAFSDIANRQGIAIGTNNIGADYDSWSGIKTNIDNCNSVSVYNEFCKLGRIFVSEEYESQSVVIKKLEARIQNLEKEKEVLERRIVGAQHSEKSKVKKDIDELNKQLQQKDEQIENLNRNNEEYQASIEIVSKELNKFAKVSKSVTKVQGAKSQYQNRNKTDLLKICLLFLILIFTVISSILNFSFFRNSSSFDTNKEGEQQTKEVAEEKPENDGTDEGTEEEVSFSFEIAQSTLNAKPNGETLTVGVKCNSEWDVPPSSRNWVTIAKKDDEHMTITVARNVNTKERECTFTIHEQQLKITQAGQPTQDSTPTAANYKIIVTCNEKALSEGSEVTEGESLQARVENPSLAAQGYGWKYENCNGVAGNQKVVNVKITGKPGETAIIAYGMISKNPKDRKQFKLKIVAKPEAPLSSDTEESEESVN